MPMLSQMMPGMGFLVVVVWLLFTVVTVAVVVAAVVLLRWAAARHFGLMVRDESNGQRTVRISLRNMLLYVAIVPAILGIGWKLWHARDEELAAEGSIVAVGGDVLR